MGAFDCAAQRDVPRCAAQVYREPLPVYSIAQRGAMRRAARREFTMRPKNNPTYGWLADTYGWLAPMGGWQVSMAGWQVPMTEFIGSQ